MDTLKHEQWGLGGGFVVYVLAFFLAAVLFLPSCGGGSGGSSGVVDTDSDGIADTLDNCPSTINRDQRDDDLDGIGDTCDSQVDKVTRVPDEVRESFDLDPFYKKYLDGFGVPIVSSEKVEDKAFFVVRNLMERMLSERPDVIEPMIEGKIRVAIMADEEVTTDIPEHADLYEVFPETDWNTRARGLGATLVRPATSVGEENLLGFVGDPYVGESIFIHEFAHTIHEIGIVSIDPEFMPRLQAAYENAIEAGLWLNTYAATNVYEYWAEGVQSWFNSNLASDPPDGIHNSIDTREELKTYDAVLAELIAEWLSDDEWRYEYPY